MRVDVSGNLPPLETDRLRGEEVKKSDHQIAFVQAAVERVPAYEMLEYQYRFYNAAVSYTHLTLPTIYSV